MLLSKKSVKQLSCLKLIQSLFDGGRGGNVVCLFVCLFFLGGGLSILLSFGQLSLPSLNLFGILIISFYCVSGLNRPGMELLTLLHERK